MISIKEVKTNIVRISAILMICMCIIITFCTIVSVFAVTEQGFCTESEVNPPNSILFNNVNTGIISNESDATLYCACCQALFNEGGAWKAGMITFATSKPNANVTIQNVMGQVTVTPNDWYTVYIENTAVGYAALDGCNTYSGQVSSKYPKVNFRDYNGGLQARNQAALDFIQFANSGGGNTQESKEINYSLPAGNVAYIELANDFDGFGLTTTMPVKSDAFSSSTGWNSTQRWGFASTIATNGTQLANFGDQIPWEKNTMQTNILGQTVEAYYYPTGPFSQSAYLVIVNPLYYAIQYTNGEGIFPSDAGVNQTVNNNEININCDGVLSITVFQLTQNVTINNNIPSYSNEVSSGPYEGEVDPDTGDITWTDPGGGSNQPTTGGGNVPGTGETSFTSLINGIANRIVNVFQPAHDAIITLSNAVTNFAGWLYALYVWLPAPILTLLTSAISIAIIIGVIKVFI